MSKLIFARAALTAMALMLSAGLQAQMPTPGAGVFGADPAKADAAPGPAATVRPMVPQQALPAPVAAKAPDVAPARPPVRVSPPNQFQRFVQESTGRLLPVYGSELFDAPEVYAADAAAPAPDNYILGPGDEVKLQVWGPVDFNTSLTLDRNGQVNLPKVGVVMLAGVAVRDLDKTLRAQLGKVFTNFNASASLGRLRGIQVYVVGQALQPGSFHLSSLSTLVNALFASGGPTANGSMRNIELKRDGKTVSTLDLYDFIARGDKSHDLALMAGDVIVIPPVGPRVAVTGAFDQAAIFELKAGATSVGDILALGGGVPALAKTKKALLERIVGESNPPRQVQEIVLDEPGLKLALRDGDVLTLLGISPAFANAVTLQGVVAESLRYKWFDGMKIQDLIPNREALITGDYYKRMNLLVQRTEGKVKSAAEAKADIKEAGSKLDERVRGLADQINWEYAVIERMDRSKLSTQIISFNLRQAVLERDPAQNLPLLAGDIVTILSQNEMRLPQERLTRIVRVEGEVAAPGVYQTRPGETLAQLLQRVGGLTPQAYLFGTEFNRESVRLRQQENLDTLVRRMEAQAQSQSTSFSANLGADRAAQAPALLQQQQAQVRGQIDRLKALRSNGRMALELDPQATTLGALPALPLEDGDRIHVPPVPGFVSASGSVNNENALIYKPGKTVGDVLKTAGLTEDADVDQAFVLRADGSIVSRRDRSGLFGGSFESMPVMPGDTLVVPAQLDRESRYSFITRAVKDWTQVLANLGLSIAAFKSVGVL